MSNDRLIAEGSACQGIKPIVSVVIPFYNCEKTIDACLCSVLGQTFTDFEVVCIDDGSTDGTSEKLDQYAALDHRVTVITQENSGQACARNLGVNVAKANTIAFIDGDDVCSPYYLESMTEHFDEGAIVCGQNIAVSEKSVNAIGWSKPEKVRVLTKKEAVLSVLYNIIEEGPYSKLIPRRFLLDHPFPAGKLYEDLAIIGDIVMEAESVVVIEGPIYAYIMHEGSTVRSATCSIRNVYDYEYALDRLCSAVKTEFENIDSAIVFRKSLSYLRMRPLCLRVNDDVGRAMELEREHAVFLRHNLVRILKDGHTPIMHKLRVTLRIASPRVYDCFMYKYGIIKKGVA